MGRANSLEKTQMLGKIEGNKTRGWQRMGWLDGLTDSMDINLSKLQKMVEDRGAWQLQSMRSQRVGHNSVTEKQHQPLGSYNTVTGGRKERGGEEKGTAEREREGRAQKEGGGKQSKEGRVGSGMRRDREPLGHPSITVVGVFVSL